MTVEARPARPRSFKHPMKLKRERGGVLLATLVFVIILSTAAASILALSLFSHRLALRNDLRAQARSVAETELDWIYYNFMNRILAGNDPSTTPDWLATSIPIPGIPSTPPGSYLCDTGAPRTTVLPTTDRDPWLAAYRADGWKVRRSVVLRDTTTGMIAGTNKKGDVTYVDVRVEVHPPAASAFAGFVERDGRTFSCSRYSIFQYAIFFQGDLEMAPGGNMTINGDISANGSIYMGASADRDGNPGVLTINNQVRYLSRHYFNFDPDTGTTVYRKPGTPGGAALSPPVFGTDQDQQVQTMDKQENLLGGLNAGAIQSERPDLFPTVNDVYRSLIAPPPEKATAQEYPNYTGVGTDTGIGDNPTIHVERMYTRASLVITVDDDGTPHYTKKDGTEMNLSNFAGVLTDFSANPGTTPPIFVKSVADQRENCDVYITEINVDVLNTQLQTYFPDFAGSLYVNLKNAYAVHPSAIRLKNGASTPIPAGADKGFSVTTNGGIYVVGNYNTDTRDADGNPVVNPAMLMGDSVTLLSTNWDDNKANQPIDQRHATPGTTTINAGVLTGNVSATSEHSSGGAQNLIRYLEDWGGVNVVIKGSLGRLFDSKYFIRTWRQPGDIYRQPFSRSFIYDTTFQSGAPPPDSPQTTEFNRGSMINW